MKIGNVNIENNLVLAPMAGVTDLPFRILCREQGCGLMYTEMVSAKAVLYNNKNTEALLEVEPEENPISLQLFGSDPQIMADMAKRLEERPFDIFDINMGCPVPKIVNNGEGSALMKNPKSDVTVLLITFFLTIIFDLTIAIEVGLIIACLLFMKRMSETTDVKAITEEIDLNQDAEFSTGNLDHLIIPQGVEVYEINGPYFFGAGNKFEEIMASFGDRPKVRIIRMRKVPFVDSTGIHNLTNLCEMSKKEGIQIVLSGVREKVNGQLEHAGFYHLIGEENICSHINLALKRANEIIEK